MSKVEVVRDRNHLVVVGEGIDSVKLVNSLRKKFCFADILTIHNHNATTTVFEEERRSHEEDERSPPRIRYQYPTRTTYDQPGNYYMAYSIYDPDPPTSCSIMWLYIQFVALSFPLSKFHLFEWLRENIFIVFSGWCNCKIFGGWWKSTQKKKPLVRSCGWSQLLFNYKLIV